MSVPEGKSAIELYLALGPGDFPLLSRFDLSYHQDLDGEQWLSLHLELRPLAPADVRLLLTFTGVSSLRFTPGDGFVCIPIGLEISDISDRQWEGAGYQVFNREQDVELAFYARGFEATTITTVTAITATTAFGEKP